MGCGASSKPKPLSDEERVTVCIAVAKEMMIYCVPRAMADPSKIVVPAPSEIDNLKSSVTQLRDAAKKFSESGQDSGAAQGENKPAGGMMGAIAGFCDKAADAVQGAVNTVGAAGLNAAADSLEKAVNSVEQPFTQIGKEIVEKKKEQISKVFEIYIGNLKMQNDAVALVRGEAPYEQAQCKAVKSDAISCYLIGKADKNLTTALMKEVEEEIKNHNAVKAWDSAIGNFNSASEQVNSVKFCKENNIVLQSFKLDIKEYIVEKTIASICGIMGSEEKAARDNPNEKTRKPRTFAMTFSGEPMDERILKALKQEQEYGVPT